MENFKLKEPPWDGRPVEIYLEGVTAIMRVSSRKNNAPGQ